VCVRVRECERARTGVYICACVYMRTLVCVCMFVYMCTWARGSGLVGCKTGGRRAVLAALLPVFAVSGVGGGGRGASSGGPYAVVYREGPKICIHLQRISSTHCNSGSSYTLEEAWARMEVEAIPCHIHSSRYQYTIRKCGARHAL